MRIATPSSSGRIGRTAGSYDGPHHDSVERSLITLKALTYRPTGGLVAAPTTSLPEKIGGERNWDYRFCWLRDTAFTLLVLLHAGYKEEALAWRGWLLRAISGSAEQMQSLYGLGGERQLNEWTADWLDGYEHSKPVNIGNKAADQLQLDVYGEVIAALARTPVETNDMWSGAVRGLVTNMLDHLTAIWRDPDSGIWETRGEKEQFVHSKMMAWVAFERAITAYEQGGGGGDERMKNRVDDWRKTRSEIHADVCEKGFDPELNSFVQAYGSKRMDAALLRMAIVGFLPANDPRMIGTVACIEKRLMSNGLLLRYDTSDGSDGLPPGEGTFLACSFWLVSVLYLQHREKEACDLFDRLLALRNPLGLLAEEYDPVAKRQLGNYPQAFTHLSLAHAAMILSGVKGPWTGDIHVVTPEGRALDSKKIPHAAISGAEWRASCRHARDKLRERTFRCKTVAPKPSQDAANSSIHVPAAVTRRLHLRPGGRSIADYIRELGVSHVYSSPYLQAGKGSMHGYDVVDHHKVNAELGGEDGTRAFLEGGSGELGPGPGARHRAEPHVGRSPKPHVVGRA